MKCNFILCDYLLTGEPKGVLDVRKDVIETILKHEKLVKTEAAEIYSSITRGRLKLENRRRSLRRSSTTIWKRSLSRGSLNLENRRRSLRRSSTASGKRSPSLTRFTSSIENKKKQLQTSAKYGSTSVRLACRGSFCATDESIVEQFQLYGSAQPTALERDQLLKIQPSTEPPVQSSLSTQYEEHLPTGLTSDVRESTSGALFHKRELSVTQSSSSPKILVQISPQSKSLQSKPLSSTTSSQNLPLSVSLPNEDIKPSTSVSEFPPQSLKTSVFSSVPQLQKSRDDLGEKKEPKKLIKEFPKRKPKQSIQERTSISTSIANPVLSKESRLSSTVDAFLREEEQLFKEDFTKKGECWIRILL